MTEYRARVIGKLPFYVPIREEVVLEPSLIGAEKFSLAFKHESVSRISGIQESRGIDDGRGNLVHSEVVVEFDLGINKPDNDTDVFLEKALKLCNSALLAIQYVAREHRIHQIQGFDRHQTTILSKNDTGEISVLFGDEGSYFGPHGLSPMKIINQNGEMAVWLHFNNLRPLYPSFLLIIESKKSLDLGDYSRAIFEIATGLQIHVETLISEYSKVGGNLKEIDLEINTVYHLYDRVLELATGRSLHEKPELFIALEYIWQIRNSIVHQWSPQFKVTSKFEGKTKYLDEHRKKDGHLVSTKEEVEELRKKVGEIFEFAETAFFEKYGPTSF